LAGALTALGGIFDALVDEVAVIVTPLNLSGRSSTGLRPD
jgi:hypothetical protein